MTAVSATVGFARATTRETLGNSAAYGPRHQHPGKPSSSVYRAAQEQPL